MTQTPADKTAKRISQQEWLARCNMGNAVEMKTPPSARSPRRVPWAPADRVAIRA